MPTAITTTMETRPQILKPAVTASAQPSQKSMTKAERRELQERQRAAKLSQKQSLPSSSSPSANKQKPEAKSKPPTTPLQKKQFDSNKPPHTPSQATMNAKESKDAAPAEASTSLRIFSHFSTPKPVGQGAKGDVYIHPTILRLALQFSEFKICGANARCIATLTAFQTVIQDYVTPPNNTLSRHLMTHLSPQISHLVSARPMSVTMGNAIRQLKLEISASDIDLPEQDAKDDLCSKIDTYIRERIIMADEVIEELAAKKINDGDTVLTYARSSVVQKVLLRAHADGKRFSVIVVDSRPLLEGKTLLHALTATVPPIPCTYALLPALPSVLTEAKIVLVGAHSLHSNGAAYSRAGTALVATMAKEANVPVVVCCETYKFSETVMLDGFAKNELAPSRFSSPSSKKVGLKNVQSLDPLYDLTPPNCVTAVVTEVGLIPPSSISSIPLALGKTSF